MSFKINPSAWGAAFPLPSQIVDKHIKMAGATQLKALLWVFRHASDEINLDDLSAAIGQKRADVIDALHFWVENGIILQDDIIPEIISEKEDNSTSIIPISSIKQVQDEPQKRLAPLPVTKPTNEQIIARGCESSDIKFLFNEAQTKLGRTIGYEGQCALLMMHDQYGLPVEVILMIIEYAVSVNKISYSYISGIGKDWGEKEIDTIEKADEQITHLRSSNSLWKQFAAMAGITNPRPTSAQLPYIKSWGDLGFDAEMIYLAYEQMANHCQRLSLPYIDKILKTWHKSGIKTPEDVENSNQTRAALKTKKASEQNNEASYDLEEFKRRSLYEPIVYEKRKKQ